MRRPFGLKILGGVSILGGVFGLLTCGIAFSAPTLMEKMMGMEHWALQRSTQAPLSSEQRNTLQAVQDDFSITETALPGINTGLRSENFRRFLAIGSGVSGLLLLCGLGIMRRQRWARWLAIGISVLWLSAMLLVLMLPTERPADGKEWILFAGSVALGTAVLWYFLRPSVKAQFVSKEPSEGSSKGVRILAMLSAAFGLLGLLESALSVRVIMSETGHALPGKEWVPWLTLAGVVFRVIYLFGLFVSGVALWKRQTWARHLILTCAGMWFVWNLPFLLIASTRLRHVMMLGITWNGLILWYFLRPAVKAQFQKSSSGRERC